MCPCKYVWWATLWGKNGLRASCGRTEYHTYVRHYTFQGRTLHTRVSLGNNPREIAGYGEFRWSLGIFYFPFPSKSIPRKTCISPFHVCTMCVAFLLPCCLAFCLLIATREEAFLALFRLGAGGWLGGASHKWFSLLVASAARTKTTLDD